MIIVPLANLPLLLDLPVSLKKNGKKKKEKNFPQRVSGVVNGESVRTVPAIRCSKLGLV